MILMQEIIIFKNHDIPLGTEATVPATRPSCTWNVSTLVVHYHCGRQSGMYISTPVPKEEKIFVTKNNGQRILFIKIIFHRTVSILPVPQIKYLENIDKIALKISTDVKKHI